MIIDPQDTRKISRNWREYLYEMQESWAVARWVYREFITAESRRWSRRMLIALAISVTALNGIAWLAKYMVDGLIRHNVHAVKMSFAGMAACVLVYGYFEYLQGIARHCVQNANSAQLKRRMNELFFEKSMGQHLQESSYLNTANIERGKGRIEQLESMLTFEGASSLISLGVALTLLWIRVPAAGLFMSLLLVSYLVWLVYLNRNISEKCVPFDKEFRRINRWEHERWEKIERVKTCAKEHAEIEYQDRSFRKIQAEERKFWFWFIGKVRWRGYSNRFVLLGTLAYGAWRIWQGDWSNGIFVPLLMYATNVSDSVWHIGHIEHQINWNMPAIRTAMLTLTVPPDINDKPNAVELSRADGIRLEMLGVSYGYAPDKRDLPRSAATAQSPKKMLPVLHDVNLTIEPGEKAALIGPSGAGKTTIMRLLMRYMDPTSGMIMINGHDLRDVRLASWLDLIAYVPQQAQVFDGTIRDNLLYRFTDEPPAVPDDELWEIMRKLRIDFGDRLTEGLDTRVGRHGIELSGGEQQRLMIGAAAMRKPVFMVVDEATASLDATTEKAVQKGLEQVLGDNIGALIITHRLSTVRHLCSKFFVLRDCEGLSSGQSQLEAVAGSFEELYEASPTFRRLADDQGIVIFDQANRIQVSTRMTFERATEMQYLSPESAS
ncbi:MAG: ABC transporter ATP-binding protein [Acidobacteria bacterium]|nr:ABC transporter ATP-binding protein [Acidobacteriota bacterium]MBV9144916.1 ABC transporter ATP-binding protein [Acidobacteriota bacterium]